jgi:hypothetical protein
MDAHTKAIPYRWTEGHFCERVRDSWTGLFKTSLRLHNAPCVVCVGTAHCLNASTHGSIQTSASDWSSATSRCGGSWWWWWGTTCRCGRSHSAPAQAQTPHASRYVEQDTVYLSVIQIQICQMPFLRACRVDWEMLRARSHIVAGSISLCRALNYVAAIERISLLEYLSMPVSHVADSLWFRFYRGKGLEGDSSVSILDRSIDSPSSICPVRKADTVHHAPSIVCLWRMDTTLSYYAFFVVLENMLVWCGKFNKK